MGPPETIFLKILFHRYSGNGNGASETVPGTGSTKASNKKKLDELDNVAQAVENLVALDLKPLDILTRESFLNAIKLVYIFGGSTNAVIHLLAMAKATGTVDLSLDDFQELAPKTPVLMNMKPHGQFVMSDLDELLGGTARVMKYLIQNGVLEGSCMTVTGKSLWDNVKDLDDFTKEEWDLKLLHPLERPFKDDGHIKILRGNLAPRGSLSKIYNLPGGKIVSRAKVFDSEDEMVDALSKHEIKEGHCVILRRRFLNVVQRLL